MANFGSGDATFVAAGGEEGVTQLVARFYQIMQSDQRFVRIWRWHPSDEDHDPQDRLARFLCGWMGGPRKYHEKYGSISIPGVHAHLAVTAAERDMWLQCMEEALRQLQYPQDFKDYLLTQLAVPAEHIRAACEQTID